MTPLLDQFSLYVAIESRNVHPSFFDYSIGIPKRPAKLNLGFGIGLKPQAMLKVDVDAEDYHTDWDKAGGDQERLL